MRNQRNPTILIAKLARHLHALRDARLEGNVGADAVREVGHGAMAGVEAFDETGHLHVVREARVSERCTEVGRRPGR